MKRVRIIPRLDIKGPNVVKGIQLEGLRVIGSPAVLAKRYYEQGADEILYIDTVASLYERNNLTEIVENMASNGIYIPVTVGGGIRSVEDVRTLLRAGADKVAINTAATRNPELITKAAEIFGSQCIVGSIEAKFNEGKWECYVDNGRERTGLDALEWAKKLAGFGAGELLVTSVDREGTMSGYDHELLGRIASSVSVPVLACGGARDGADVADCLRKTGCDGACFASILHYNRATIGGVKEELARAGIATRKAMLARVQANPSPNPKEVSIIDYGAGNLKSVRTAFSNLGNPVKLVTSAAEIEQAQLLVLPGDGAFGFGMSELEKRGLIAPIRGYVKSGRPFFGICLGMQLLLSESLEFGRHGGLGIIPGRVLPFKPVPEVREPGYRVPQIGWNQISKPKGAQWDGTPLESVPDGSEAYFVHSFYAAPEDGGSVLASSVHGGQEFCSVIRKGNVFGTQFHPEKSGEVGMRMLQWFSRLL